MKRIYFFAVLMVTSASAFSQAYRSMPTDSARWRYRIFVNDDLQEVTDLILYVNGTDTVINSTTYHKVYSRSNLQIDTIGANPPIVSETANSADVFFGGIREANKYVYFITAGPEQLIFNFNAVVGDHIPGSMSTVTVTSIDSILIGSHYHKRYNTTDSTYYVIEGEGSNRGLIPDFVDGSGIVTFHCFTREIDTVWSPDTTIPCTMIYPISHTSVKAIGNESLFSIYPNPSTGRLHIQFPSPVAARISIVNSMGQQYWSGDITSSADLETRTWPPGIYYLYCISEGLSTVRKLVVE